MANKTYAQEQSDLQRAIFRNYDRKVGGGWIGGGNLVKGFIESSNDFFDILATQNFEQFKSFELFFRAFNSKNHLRISKLEFYKNLTNFSLFLPSKSESLELY